MNILLTILLIIVGVIILIGIIRVITTPYSGLVNFLMEMMLLDWLVEGLGNILSTIGDLWDD